MKICYLIDGLRSGGKERQLYELINGLIEKKYLKPENILLITLAKNGYFDESFQKLKINFKYAIRKIKKDPGLVFKLNGIIKEFKPEIIHSFSSMTTTYSVFLKIFFRFELFDGSIRSAPFRNTVHYKTKLFNSFNYRFSNVIISNSKAGLISYKAPLRKAKVLHNGFNIDRVKDIEKPEIVRKRLNIDTKFVVGMVASFSYKKDYSTFLSAAKLILNKRNDVSFIAVGNGDNLKSAQESVKKYEKIIFTGSQKKVEDIINSFDLGILSTFTEGISNSIIEYMILGKPVIATEGGGTREIVVDKITGFLIKQKSPEQLSERIEYLLNNLDIAQKMGEKGKERIETEFSLKKMTDSYFQLYNNVLTK
jgi:glycosyltransferase involved in cell wall biosynthesis